MSDLQSRGAKVRLMMRSVAGAHGSAPCKQTIKDLLSKRFDSEPNFAALLSNYIVMRCEIAFFWVSISSGGASAPFSKKSRTAGPSSPWRPVK